MGLQTVLVVNNDCLYNIATNKNLGPNLHKVCRKNPRETEVINGLQAVDSSHSSGVLLIAVHKYKGREWRFLSDNDKLKILDKLKYELPLGIKIIGLKKALKPIKKITKDML